MAELSKDRTSRVKGAKEKLKAAKAALEAARKAARAAGASRRCLSAVYAFKPWVGVTSCRLLWVHGYSAAA
jgi:hypothetical protein